MSILSSILLLQFVKTRFYNLLKPDFDLIRQHQQAEDSRRGGFALPL
jgi:hypothetical protein